ncbi:MAG: type II 3-dehydroquinate dehydratase [Pseudomonadota bacterium]
MSENAVILVLNGPNLNLLGTREPEVYGHQTLADLEAMAREAAATRGLEIEFHQSNAEHALVDWIQGACGRAAAIVINPAAFTHTSVAILDALQAFNGPIIEVHLSNVHAREPFRRHSYVSPVAAAVIAGCGGEGYRFAVERAATLIGGR